MFGPGLVKTFDLEQKHAKYPRIIVDVDIVSGFGNIPNDEFIAKINEPPPGGSETWDGPVLEDWGPGRYELGRFHRDLPFQIDFLGQFLKPSPDFGDRLTTLCENIIRKAREGFEAYEKMKWVADYLTMRVIKEENFQFSDIQTRMLESI